MKKLFMIGIGGGIEKANIEVHDIRFVATDSIEDACEILRKDWFGSSLHIDEYMIIEFVDGHRVLLMDDPQESEDKLFFVNMGGSIDQRFGEAHEYGLFVSTTKENAECRGQSSLLEHAYDKHIDYVYDVQSRLKSADGKNVFIHLVSAGEKVVRNNYYNTYIKL
jgi:hypothetical protein